MSYTFQCYVYAIVLYISLNIMMEALFIIFLSNQLLSFLNFKLSSQKITINSAN